MINVSLNFMPKQGMRFLVYGEEKYVAIDISNKEFENNNLLQFTELLTIKFKEAYERLKEYKENERI